MSDLPLGMLSEDGRRIAPTGAVLSQEFNEGDVGVAGGIQVLEPANQHPTSVESIRRYGGSTAPSMPWPEEPGSQAAFHQVEGGDSVLCTRQNGFPRPQTM